MESKYFAVGGFACRRLAFDPSSRPTDRTAQHLMPPHSIELRQLRSHHNRSGIADGGSSTLQLDMILAVPLFALFVGVHLLERKHARWAAQRGRNIACFGCMAWPDLPNPTQVHAHSPSLEQTELTAVERIDELPCAEWEDASSVDISCSLCLELFEPGETVTMLACGHQYHKSCITRWLKSRRFQTRRCPLCNADALAHPSLVPLPSSPSSVVGFVGSELSPVAAAAPSPSTQRALRSSAAAAEPPPPAETTANSSSFVSAAATAAAVAAAAAPLRSFAEAWISPGGTRHADGRPSEAAALAEDVPTPAPSNASTLAA